MTPLVIVKIVGAPVACEEGVTERWREVAEWVIEKLHARYGHSVHVIYYDLFDPDCPALAANSQLPVVFVGETLVSSGGKISIPLLRKKIDELGIPHEYPENESVP